MKRYYFTIWLLTAILLGCPPSPSRQERHWELVAQIGSLRKAGRYCEAFKLLPEMQSAWDAYTRRTGDTAEGTAGYVSSDTFMQICVHGDAHWGKILDDPDIPYDYKTELISEIANYRLGKGASWSPWHTEVVIIPRSKGADSWKEINALLRKVLSEQGVPTDTDKPQQKK